jgi:hypothetical protein
MATIKIDGKDYDYDALSADAKSQLAGLQFVDSELARLSNQSAAFQTARMAYANALKESLNPPAPQLPGALSGDTIKFS